jgi:uncharacterized protein (TIGR03067 family)
VIRTILLATSFVSLSAIASSRIAAQETSQKPVEVKEPQELLGVWNAKLIESDGMKAPDDAVKLMRFTFQKDKLLIRGNFADDREQECTYRIDSKQTPKQIDISPKKENQTLLAIYEFKQKELRVCLRREGENKTRPTEFSTQPNSNSVLVVFEKQVEAPAKPLSPELEALQGLWQLQSGEMNGEALPDEVASKVKMVFQGTKLTISGVDGKDEVYDVQIDGKKSPKHIDFTKVGTEQTMKAIFEISDQKLKFCGPETHTGERPTSFKTNVESKSILLRLSKQ